MLTERRAKVYTDDREIRDRADRLGSSYSSFMSALNYLQEEEDIRYKQVIYYKKAKDDNIDRNEWESESLRNVGWDLCVLYVSDISIFEVYRRNGFELSDYEMNALLMLQGSGLRWLRIDDLEDEQRQLAGLEIDKPFINPDYIRSDWKVAAKRDGNAIAFYSTSYHTKLAQLREKTREATAPESVIGF